MRQGIQAELPDAEIMVYGCYFLCLLALAEKKRGREITDTEIIQIKNFARVQGWLEAECFVRNPGSVYGHAAFTGTHPLVVKVSAPPAAGDYIVCGKKPAYTHFTAVIDGKSWDPLPPDRPAAQSYRPDSYRVIRGGA